MRMLYEIFKLPEYHVPFEYALFWDDETRTYLAFADKRCLGEFTGWVKARSACSGHAYKEATKDRN